MCDNALAIALVRAHIIADPAYMSWVPSYVKVRWGRDSTCVAERVGGHWRRLAHAKRTIDALACVCKQDLDLVAPEPSHPRVGRGRKRHYRIIYEHT